MSQWKKPRGKGYLISAERQFIQGQFIDRISPFLIKLYKLGNVLWSKCFYLNSFGFKRFCHIQPNGDMLLGFNTDCQYKIFSSFSFLTKIDSAGKIIWTKELNNFILAIGEKAKKHI